MVMQTCNSRVLDRGLAVHQRGFTLIEMMIVVTIIAVLASIAFPAMSDYLKKGRRSDGRAILMQIAGKQEQYFLNNRSYTKTFTDLGDLAASKVTADTVTSEKGYYTVSITATSDTSGRIYTYTLTATATGGQAGDNCKTLTINEAGVRGFTPSTATQCW